MKACLLAAFLALTGLAELSFELGPRAVFKGNGFTEVAKNNSKGQTIVLADAGQLTAITLRVSSVTVAKDLALHIHALKQGLPTGDPLFSDAGMLPADLMAGQPLTIRLASPQELAAGSYAIILTSKASKMRFHLVQNAYRDGRLVRRQTGGWSFGAGLAGDLHFVLEGKGMPVLGPIATTGSVKKPKKSKVPVVPTKPIALDRTVSTNVTPLVDKLPSRPNIVTVMVDDLGWNQIGVKQTTMGSAKAGFVTPNLAKLADGGLSFTHAYSQPNCAPTRAAMLSGQYPARIHNDVYVVGSLNRNGGSGISKADAKFTGPEQSTLVALDAITVAEALQKNGYATAHIGKFHVGNEETFPENVGFDINIGGSKQGHQPTCFASKKGDAWAFRGLGRGDFDRFGAPYTAEYLDKYGFPKSLLGKPKHVSDAVGDAMEETVAKLNATGKPFYLQLHPYAVHGPVKSRPDLLAEFGNLQGFVHSIDLIVGRLLVALDDPNGDGDTADSVAANTLVMFTSDNGGTHGDNLPLRGNKGMFTEGGIRVPLIAYWPGVIPPNTVTDYMVHSLDYYPTYLELAGKSWMPPEADHPLDGESFAAILHKPDLDRTRKPLFFLFPGYMDSRAQPCAVAIDDIGGQRHKLLYFYEADAWQLYNVTEDTHEVRNLISDKPEVGKAMSAKIRSWLSQEHPTWKPKFPLRKPDGKSAGPPPLL